MSACHRMPGIQIDHPDIILSVIDRGKKHIKQAQHTACRQYHIHFDPICPFSHFLHALPHFAPRAAAV